MASFAFNAGDHNPSSTFEPIPAGKYPAVIEATEIVPTKNGSGKRLKLTFSVLGGEFNNRKIFEGLNIENPNAEAQRISLENLSAICHATGVMNLTNTDQLLNKPMTIVVKIKPASGEYEAQNVIKGYEAAGAGGATGGPSQRPATGGQRPAAAQQRPANAGAGRPAPAQQSRPAPAQNAGRPAPQQAQGGRPAGANAPLRQAPQQAPVQQQDEAQDWTDDVSEQQNYGDAAGQFEGGDDAPWDNEG